jgi:hypothetical protein
MIHRFCFVYVVALSLTSLGADPFTIMQGRDSNVPKQPQACTAPNGSVHLAFGVGDQVYHCNIGDETDAIAQVAFKVPNMSLGMRRGPRIAHTGSAITITAIGGAVGKGRDGDVLAYRSLDSGKSWLGPVKVNDIEASAREGLHAAMRMRGVVFDYLPPPAELPTQSKYFSTNPNAVPVHAFPLDKCVRELVAISLSNICVATSNEDLRQDAHSTLPTPPDPLAPTTLALARSFHPGGCLFGGLRNRGRLQHNSPI